MRLALLGAGRMGLPIAARLVAAGHDLDVVDPDAARAAAASASGIRVADRLPEGVEVLVTVLPGPPEVEAAVRTALPILRTGALWLDLSSNDPTVADRLGAEADARGIAAVAAPMGGGPTAAADGTLRFFVGGHEAAVARIAPLLEALGGADAIERVGTGLGGAHTAKLLANLLWFGQVVAVTEALLLGASLGVAPGTLRRILPRSAGGSVFIDQHLDALLDGDDLATFGIDRCVEELDTLSRLASKHGVPFELSDTVTRLHREALERFGAIDGELLAARLLEERAGHSLTTAAREPAEG